MINLIASEMEAELEAIFVICQRGAARHMALIELVHAQSLTPAVTYSSTGDGFINNNIYQLRSRGICMRFYWVRYRFKQGQFMVYWMAGEHNLADYFTKHHPSRHYRSKRSIYLIPTEDASKYACYMSPIDL